MHIEERREHPIVSGQQGGDFRWLVDHTSAWPKSFHLLERNDVSTFDGLNHPRNIEVAIFSATVLNVVGYELHNGYSSCSRSIVRDARGLLENSARNGPGMSDNGGSWCCKIRSALSDQDRSPVG